MVPQLCFIRNLGPTYIFQEVHGFNYALHGVGTAPVFMKPPFTVIATDITPKVY